MLATLQPAAVLEAHDLAQYRPAKDLEAFNSLLPPPIEFVEGSSSGTLAVVEGKYKPINESGSGAPKSGKTESSESRRNSQAESDKPSSSSTSGVKQLYDHPIETSWPSNAVKGCGLVNTGNTCFLNSALQCLLHTPPLINVLLRHGKEDKCASKGAFCMSCSMRELMISCYKAKRPVMPYAITSKLQHIAKHLRKGRQEDSHEFLRYAIDAMQKSCLTGYPPKIDHKLAETTWVHKIFGGRLRSRVSCLSCGYNSDTFDSILDLSVDIYNVQTLRDALRKFVTVDHLKGADKYKCEKCKKHVTADKQFTIHEAPAALTVHLKRFTPMGRKMAHPIRYDERISLQPYMSQGQHGPMYTLYGVICHAGGGPNSGHYYAFVKDANGKWYEMNDESVTPVHKSPLDIKNAYILFYLRDKGQTLDAAISLNTSGPKASKTGVAASMKRRKIVESDDEDDDDSRPSATPTKDRFIGPLLPSPSEASEPRPDPQAEKLKRKIAERQTVNAISPVKPSAALQSLSQYADEDDSSEDVGEKVEDKSDPSQKTDGPLLPLSSTSASPAVSKLPAAPPVSPISTSSFYAPTSKHSGEDNSRKRKSLVDDDDDDSLGRYARTPLTHPTSSSPRARKDKAPGERRLITTNPYNRMFSGRNGNNLPAQYGKRVKHMKRRFAV
ncbi:hypothetical protein BDY19DRAFT_905998 [Irpex rosettiformis]|uniref:Uncharacterized protein n=1 Tax=Irpex rosettiformis TaxID=378272 RepID=A0ACB8U499_9APHY|nr:hypothetical protein BDY19DRAFT_905998 [Irpex rosettiformis]